MDGLRNLDVIHIKSTSCFETSVKGCTVAVLPHLLWLWPITPECSRWQCYHHWLWQWFSLKYPGPTKHVWKRSLKHSEQTRMGLWECQENKFNCLRYLTFSLTSVPYMFTFDSEFLCAASWLNKTPFKEFYY